MRRIAAIFFSTLLICFVLFLLSDSGSAKSHEGGKLYPEVTGGEGTAIIMTGAAARITQQVALLEELYNRDLLDDVVFISGVSAGAINAVALNAIIEGKITWNDYKALLFGIENHDIFNLSENRKLPVDTEPVRKLLQGFVEDRLGYYSIGDLPGND